MSAPQFTPGPWQRKTDYPFKPDCVTIVANADGDGHADGSTTYTYDFIATCEDEYGGYCDSAVANANLIAAAPDHALICWAMCVQDGRWEEWTPYDGSGEFVFAGLRYATRIDEFGCPKLTPALREAISQSQMVAA